METGNGVQKRTPHDDNVTPRSSKPISRKKSEDIFPKHVEPFIIDNPLAHWMPEQVDDYAREFARRYGLATKTDLLLKAGRVLQDPRAWRAVPDLTAEEKAALRSETRSKRHLWQSLQEERFFTPAFWKRLWRELFPENGFWKQPKQLRVTVITLSVAAVVQGWSQAGSNGANLNWAHALLGSLGPGDHECDPFGSRAWIFALVNAAPYLSASLIGCWLSDPLSEYFLGRRAPIGISASLILASAIGSAYVQKHHWGQLLACRIIIGIGMGCKAAVVPVFAAEIAPAHLRGSLVMNWQLFDAFGIFLGFTANLIAARVGENSWRWQFASAALPALVLLGQIYASPESPRFLMKQGKYADAFQTLLAFRGEPILAAKELLYTHCQMEVEMRLMFPPKSSDLETEKQEDADDPKPKRSINYGQKLRLVFTNPRTRRAAVAAVVAMVSQQLCGVNVLEFYSSTLYGDAGNSCGEADNPHPGQHRRPLWLSFGVGLANWVFAFPAYWLIDHKGRRWLLLVTLPFMALSMLAAGASFKIAKDDPAYVPVITLFTYIFMFFYSWGMGPVPFTYAAECFPLEVRLVGMSFSVFTNFLGAGLLALVVPALTVTKIGHFGLLLLFAGLNALAFILVFLLVPETAGAAIADDPANDLASMTSMSLEELSYIFDVRTRKHVKYQFRAVLVYYWRRYVERERGVEEPVKLYRWPPHVEEGEGEEVVGGEMRQRRDRLDLNGVDGSGRLAS